MVSIVTLCIATHQFGLVSETFISDHVRSLSPDNTILICRDERGSDQFGCPVLGPVDSWRLPRTLRERAVNAFHVRWRRYVHAGLFAGDHKRVRNFLVRNRAKTVLAEYGPTGCLLARTCNAIGIPLYVHFHGYDASSLLTDKWLVRHYRAMFGRAAGVIAPSRYLANRLAEIGCPGERLHVSGYGVDPDRFSPSTRIPGRVLAVGRLVRKKAPNLTIRAFAQICGQCPDARLDMIGDGPLADECRDLIGRFGLHDRIRMHGAQPHDVIAQMMQTASLFVQHSVEAKDGNTEGLPVSILEAMTAGLPVVATMHSGIPEVVDDRATGLLVSEHDVDGMASAMAELLGDLDRARMFGEAGRERILKNYTRAQSRDRLRDVMGLS